MILRKLEVEFVGVFPMDMLRYDSCFPVSPEDVRTIENSLANPISGKVVVGKYARSKKDKAYTWTIDRWRSFGCKVKEEEL